MPKAVKGTLSDLLQLAWPVFLFLSCKMTLGVLIECDPSIKAIILKIDQDRHDFIVEDLDDQTLVIKESQLQPLKKRLEEVRHLDFKKSECNSSVDARTRNLPTPSRCQMIVLLIDLIVLRSNCGGT